MSVDLLLSRLQNVRRTGAGRWVARCPAHDDRHPSLSIREVEDGRVLVYCFAGCGVEQILGALDLGFDALFAERAIGHYAESERRPFNARDVLQCVAFEALVVSVAASRLRSGIALTDVDRERLLRATERLTAAAEFVSG
jgi:hypothetical protein